MKNQNNIILIIAIVIVLAVAAYFIFKPKSDKTASDTEGGASTDKDIKSGVIVNDVNPKTPTSTTTTTSPGCGYMKYKRDTEDPGFKLLTDDELFKNADSFVNKMRVDGHSDDFISFAAAFLKGMDLALKIDLVRKYMKDIQNFKGKADIRRDGNFRTEVQQQVYDVGSLICNPIASLFGFLKF